MKTPKGQELDFDTAKKGGKDDPLTKVMKKLNSSNFTNSLKYGYLYKRSESLFREWSEKFCVLTNVGLLYYDDPNKRPRNLFPTIDSTIQPVPADVRLIGYILLEIQARIRL